MVKECVLNMSESKEIKEAIKEWYVYTHHVSKYGNYRCHCGRAIKNIYLFKNTKTGNFIQLGAICQNVFIEQVRYYNKYLKVEKPQMELCFGCKKLILWHETIKRCDDCKLPSYEELLR